MTKKKMMKLPPIWHEEILSKEETEIRKPKKLVVKQLNDGGYEVSFWCKSQKGAQKAVISIINNKDVNLFEDEDEDENNVFLVEDV